MRSLAPASSLHGVSGPILQMPYQSDSCGLLGHSPAAGQAKWEQVLRFIAPDHLFAEPAANRSHGDCRPDGATCEQDADIVATSLERALANARRRVPVPSTLERQHNELPQVVRT